MIVTDKTFPESGQYPFPSGGVPRYVENPNDNVIGPATTINTTDTTIGPGFTPTPTKTAKTVDDLIKFIVPPETPKKKDPRIEKYPHYFKDVSSIDFIDVYTIIRLWNITDPCIQHALKKLIVSGGRGGGKSKVQDIQEAIDSLERFKELELLLTKQETVTK